MRTMGLKIKILAGTVGIIVFLGLAMMVLVGTYLHKTLDSELEKRAISIAKHIAQSSVNPLLTERFIELELMVRDYKRSEDEIEYIFVLDSRGETTAHTFENGFPADLKRMNIPEGGRQYDIQRIETERGAILDIAVPLLGGTAGVAHVGMSEGPVHTAVNAFVRMIMAIFAIVLVAGVALTAVLSSAIARPVRELAAAAEAVENGDLSTRVRARSGGEFGLLGSAFNKMIEARGKAEEELRKSEKKLRDIASSLGEGVLVLNAEGRLEFMNPEAERLLGWTAAELAGRQMHDAVHGRRENGSLLIARDCPSLKVFETGERVFVDDDVYVRKDGTFLPVAFITAPVKEGGAVVAVVVAFHDISKRKKYESEREQLIQAYKSALDNVKTLKGLMPICASCKRIRDDAGYWNQIEAYIQAHSDAEFSHGICPECAKKLYPEYYKEGKDRS